MEVAIVLLIARTNCVGSELLMPWLILPRSPYDNATKQMLKNGLTMALSLYSMLSFCSPNEDVEGLLMQCLQLPLIERYCRNLS